MKFFDITIIGPLDFKKQTIKALKLIKEKSKSDFLRINKYLKCIKSARQSGMVLAKAQFNVGRPTAFYSVEWYAGCIVHDTHHYFLHTVKKLLWGKGNYAKHEKLCLREQVRFLKKIKAPNNLVKHCKGQLKLKYWTKSYMRKNPNW